MCPYSSSVEASFFAGQNLNKERLHHQEGPSPSRSASKEATAVRAGAAGFHQRYEVWPTVNECEGTERIAVTTWEACQGKTWNMIQNFIV
jgi:hypothetical protein